MKRWGNVFAVILVISLLFCGCSQSEDDVLDPEHPVSIEMETYYNGAAKMALDELVAEFNHTIGSEQGIYVTVSTSGSMDDLFADLKEKKERPEEERNLPNIFSCYTSTAADFAAEGLLVDLDSYFSEDELNEYVEAYIEEGRIGESQELIVFPLAKSVEVLTLNKTDWDKFAADTGASLEDFETWEGIAKAAKSYYEWSDGKAMFGRDAFSNYMLTGAAQLGHDVFQVKDGEVTLDFDKDTMKTLWDNYYIPYVNGYYTSVGRYRSDDMKTGDLIAAIGSSSAGAFYAEQVTLEQEEPYDIELITLPVPNFEGTDPMVVQQGAGLAVTKGTEAEQEASALFIKWLTQEQNNTEFCLQSAYLPVKKEANDITSIEKIAEEQELAWSDVVKETQEVATGQCEEYELYTMAQFLGSDACRSLIGNSMIDKAVADRAQLDSGEITLDQLESEDNFNSWYETLKAELEGVL